MDAQGKIVREAKVASEPEAFNWLFRDAWLCSEADRPGSRAIVAPVACGVETSRIRRGSAGNATCEGSVIGDDGEDGSQGCTRDCPVDPDGVVPPGHAKSIGAQEIRALLVARKQLLGRLIDVELSIRGILRGFGLKVGSVTRKNFEARIRELVTGQATLERIVTAMLSARAALKAEYTKLHKAMLTIVRDDTVCRRLMTVPSVGPLVAITYKSAIDDPHRIAKSKAAGALFGLTPKKYQSGETNVTGGITLAGDETVRTALYEAANVLLSRITRFSKLKRWGMDVAKRRGSKRAKVALARKLTVILHRMWVDGTTYRWAEAEPIAA